MTDTGAPAAGALGGIRLDAARTAAARTLRNRWVLRGLSLALVLLLWQLTGEGRPYVASDPAQVFRAFVDSSGSQIVPAFRETLSSFLLGYVICIALGIPIGLLMARSRIAELALAPYVSILYATPIVVFIPLLIIWLGVTYNLRLVAVILIGTFPIVLNTYLGAKEVDRDLLDAGVAFSGGRFQILRTVIVPGSLPYIFAGLRIGFLHAMVATIVAEMEGTVAGVGGMIDADSAHIQIADMWVLIILLGLFNVLASMLLRAAERWATAPWNRRRLLAARPRS